LSAFTTQQHSRKQNKFSDAFTMVQKTSNRHIQAVMNNLRFMI